MDTTEYDKIFQKYSTLTGVDWRLLKAQVKQESGFNPRAVSQARAKGLAQFMPKTWKEWGDCTPGVQEGKLPSVFDPEANIAAQAHYMSMLLNAFRSVHFALAAYNYGIGNVQKLKVKCQAVSYAAIEPYLPKETQGYVDNIIKYYMEYKGGSDEIRNS